MGGAATWVAVNVWYLADASLLFFSFFRIVQSTNNWMMSTVTVLFFQAALSGGSINITALVARQMADYDPTYPAWSAVGLAALNRTRSHLDGLEVNGHAKYCSEQRYAESVTAVRRNPTEVLMFEPIAARF